MDITEVIIFTENESYKKFHKSYHDIESRLYELDPITGVLTITSKSYNHNYSESNKKRAAFIISILGVKISEIIGFICPFIFFFMLVVICLRLVDIIFKNVGIWDFFFHIVLPLFVFSIVCAEVATAADYYKNSKCRKCGRNYACVESKKPVYKKVSTNYSFENTEISYWKCKFCGYEDVRVEHIKSSGKKGKIGIPPEYCQKCKQKFSIEEYRNPDIESIVGDEITTRYYRCKHCDFNYIEKQIDICYDCY